MFVKSIVAVALFASSFVAAQNSTIDPSTVDPTTRSQWCAGQTSTCGTLCSGELAPNGNLCDPSTLNFTCLCASNDSTPGLQYYTQSMPTFICEQIFSNCITAGANDAAAQAVCTSNEKANCGHLSPANFTAVVSSSTSATPSATATGTGSGSSTAPSSSSSKAAAATMAAARNIGSGAMAIGAFAVFGYML